VPKKGERGPRQDFAGRRFGRISVIEWAWTGRLKVYKDKNYTEHVYRWKCLCDCGKTVFKTSQNLKAYPEQGCQNCTLGHQIHGESKGGKLSAELLAYRGAKSRCNNKNSKQYNDYGGRGIQFRFQSLQQFIEHIGRKPTPQHSLDRIDVNGHYEIGNVRWALPEVQRANKRPRILLNRINCPHCEGVIYGAKPSAPGRKPSKSPREPQSVVK